MLRIEYQTGSLKKLYFQKLFGAIDPRADPGTFRGLPTATTQRFPALHPDAQNSPEAELFTPCSRIAMPTELDIKDSMQVL